MNRVDEVRTLLSQNIPAESGEPCEGCLTMLARKVVEAAKDPDAVALADYSAALDEIYALRAALAVEARIIEAHLLLRSFPKSRREVAGKQVTRMRVAAKRGAGRAYADMPQRYAELKRLGAKTLTRTQWESRDGA